MKKRSKRRSMQGRLTMYERKARKAGFSRIAGLDEAGRGPLAGPVVAACVVVGNQTFHERIDDSKLLTALQRFKAYREILQKCEYGIGAVSEDMIDEVNIYQATRIAMERAVRSMPKPPDYLLIDGTVKLGLPQKRSYIVKGDRKSLSIACASIVAKVSRDMVMREYHRYYPDYGFDRHKGYGTARHASALKNLGPSPIHRMTFKPLALLPK